MPSSATGASEHRGTSHRTAFGRRLYKRKEKHEGLEKLALQWVSLSKGTRLATASSRLVRKSQTFEKKQREHQTTLLLYTIILFQGKSNINNIIIGLRNWCCVYRTTNPAEKEEFEEEILKGTLGLHENNKLQAARVSISKAFRCFQMLSVYSVYTQYSHGESGFLRVLAGPRLVARWSPGCQMPPFGKSQRTTREFSQV